MHKTNPTSLQPYWIARKGKDKTKIKERKMSSFDLGRSSLRFSFLGFLRLGVRTSEVMAFDWALAPVRSCTSIGGWHQHGSAFRLSLDLVQVCLWLGLSALLPSSIGPVKSVWACLWLGLEVSVETKGFVSYSCLLFLSFELFEQQHGIRPC